MTDNATPRGEDWAGVVDDLNRLLRLKTTPVGLSRFATLAELEAVPKVRRPDGIHTFDQVVAMAARLGWTVGATADDFVQKQCSAVLGLIPRDEEWLAGRALAGVWFATIEDSAAHQHSMDTAPYAGHAGVVVSPLATEPPDVVSLCHARSRSTGCSGHRKLTMSSVGGRLPPSGARRWPPAAVGVDPAAMAGC
jgi:uncharacterized protein (DUF169 family)